MVDFNKANGKNRGPMKAKLTTFTMLLMSFMFFVVYGTSTSSALQESSSKNNSGKPNLYATPTKRKPTPTPTRISSSSGGVLKLTIPSTPKVRPSDILDQVVLLGRGGNSDEPKCPCIFQEGNTFQLSGFKPNQEIRFAAYKLKDYPSLETGSHFYITDWLLTVDKFGKATIQITNYQNSNYSFVVLDPKTNKMIAGNLFEPSKLCTSSTYTRLKTGMIARVTITNGVPVRMRKSPYLSGKIFAEIAEGVKMTVLDGPACNDKLVWWYVDVKGKKGWMAEGADGDWFLEPWK